MNNRDDLFTTLRSIDVADNDITSSSTRARSDLQRILAADLSSDAATPRPRTRRRTVRRVAISGAAVAATTAGFLLLPSVTGGDHAFASWQPVPQAMSVHDRAEAATSCKNNQKDAAGSEYATALRNSRTAISDRRGAWTTVVLTGTDGFSALCITDDSTHLFARDMTGSIGKPTNYVPNGPRTVAATNLGMATMSAGNLSLASGTTGSDVVAVSYSSKIHGKVSATVGQGHFALWFPGDELKNASRTHPVNVEVTYRNGTTGTAQLSL